MVYPPAHSSREGGRAGTPKGWTPTTIPSRSPKNAWEFELEDQVSAWPHSNQLEKYSNSPHSGVGAVFKCWRQVDSSTTM